MLGIGQFAAAADEQRKTLAAAKRRLEAESAFQRVRR